MLFFTYNIGTRHFVYASMVGGTDTVLTIQCFFYLGAKSKIIYLKTLILNIILDVPNANLGRRFPFIIYIYIYLHRLRNLITLKHDSFTERLKNFIIF